MALSPKRTLHAWSNWSSRPAGPGRAPGGSAPVFDASRRARAGNVRSRRDALMRRLRCNPGVVCLLVLMAAGPAPAQDERPYGTPPEFEGALTSLAAINIRNARLETVVSGLNEPWALEFSGTGEALITERGGRLLRVDLASSGDA